MTTISSPITTDMRTTQMRDALDRAARRRAASGATDVRARRGDPASDGVTLRRATRADEAALTRLAQLDSARRLTGDVLVAEVAGELRAAIATTGDRAIADPFHPTAGIVELLSARASRLRAAAGGAAGRRRRFAVGGRVVSGGVRPS